MTTADQPDATGQRRAWDLALTIALLIVLGLVTVVLFFMTALLTMSCGGGSCSSSPNVTGFSIAFYGPVVLFVVATVLAIVWLVRRRLAFWIPLAGLVLAVGCYVLGGAIVTAS